MFSSKKWSTAYILCFLFGALGIHRIYTGYTIIGIIQFFTLGGAGLWTLIDFLTLSFNIYNDSDGYELEGHNIVIAIIGAIIYFFWWVPFVLGLIFHRGLI